MNEPHHTRLCDGIASEARLLAKSLADTDPGAPVAACPGWNAFELTVHLYQAVTWAAGLLDSASTDLALPHTFLPETAGNTYDPGASWPDYVDAVARDFAESGAVPTDPGERASWLENATDRMVGALRRSGPDSPVWTPFLEPRSGFWARWGALEIGVHRADVDVTLGVRPRLDRELCLDGIGYWMTAVTTPAAAGFFSPQFATLRGGDRTLLFQAQDPALGTVAQWHVRRGAEGPVLLAPKPEQADVTVTAPADLLLLLLKRRLPVTAPGVEVAGDPSLLDHWLENTFG